MIKIIKPGFLREVQCSKCGAVLSYDTNDDVETRYENSNAPLIETYIETYKKPIKYIVCPQCNYEIVVNATR